MARLELAEAPLTRVALTEDWGRGHVDVWGHPQELLAAVDAAVRQRRK